MGYSEEEIDNAISLLNERSLEALTDYYGEDLKNPTYPKIIKDKDYLNIVISTYMLRKLESQKATNTKKSENIYDKYISLGYTEEEITMVIEQLSINQIRLLHDYYGEDLKNPTYPKNINNKKDKKYFYTIISVVIKNDLYNYRNKGYLKNDKKTYTSSDNFRKYKPIYDLYMELDYREEEITEVIGSLSERQLKILHDYYGEDLKNPTYPKNIDNASEYSYLYNVIKIIIKNKLNKFRENSVLKDKITTEISKKTTMKYHMSIYEYYSTLGYKDEEIDKAINALSDNAYKFLSNIYGPDLKSEPNIDILTRDDKKRIINFKRSINNKLNKLRENKLLKDKITTDVSKKTAMKYYLSIYEYYNTLGYKDEEIDKAVNDLSDYSYKLLTNIYGPDLKSEPNIDILTNDDKRKILNIKHSINKKLENIRNNIHVSGTCQPNIYTKYTELGYTEEEINISLTQLSEKQLEALKLYYGEDLKNPTYPKSNIEKGYSSNYIYSLVNVAISKRLKNNRMNPAEKIELEIINKYGSIDNFIETLYLDILERNSLNSILMKKYNINNELKEYLINNKYIVKENNEYKINITMMDKVLEICNNYNNLINEYLSGVDIITILKKYNIAGIKRQLVLSQICKKLFDMNNYTYAENLLSELDSINKEYKLIKKK